MNKNMNKKAGFTLVELLVVVLIVGVMSAIAVPMYGRSVDRSRVSEARIQLKAYGESADRFVSQRGNATDVDAGMDVPLRSNNNFTYRRILCGTDTTTNEIGCAFSAVPSFNTAVTLAVCTANCNLAAKQNPQPNRLYCRPFASCRRLGAGAQLTGSNAVIINSVTYDSFIP